MSYINSKYARRICVGKAIGDITFNKDSLEAILVFTDGTSLRLYPHYVMERPLIRTSIIACGYDSDGNVISARGDESHT